jgi:hypothetical protein
VNSGRPLDCSFAWDEGTIGQRSGTLVVQLASLADYSALVSRLIIGTLLFDPQGHAQRMRLADPDHQPPRTFPAKAILHVTEEPFRDDDPRDRMSIGNDFLQAGTWVEVIEFEPPSKDGQEGRMVAVCNDADTYSELRRFVDEPHGSALNAWDGWGQWFVNRISDTGSVDRPFPQVVTVTVRWLRLD